MAMWKVEQLGEMGMMKADSRGVIWGEGLGALAPPPPGKIRKKKRNEKEKRKKEKKEKRKKGTMNTSQIKCCFFQFFNSPVALKNKK